uniref:Uncharacterized protein n=1 Tax=Anguilla anguilla TaxID=7936 RepID=A0A0E9X657_ANGAN
MYLFTFDDLLGRVKAYSMRFCLSFSESHRTPHYLKTQGGMFQLIYQSLVIYPDGQKHCSQTIRKEHEELLQLHQQISFPHGLSRFTVYAFHLGRPGGGHAVLHLHGFDNADLLSLSHRVSGLHGHRHHRAGHGGAQDAAAVLRNLLRHVSAQRGRQLAQHPDFIH